MIRNAVFISFMTVWAINTYGLYRVMRGWAGATWRETYNWISSVLVFDTLPLLAIFAFILGFVGQLSERRKFRFIGFAMLLSTFIIASLMGPSIYTDPLINLLKK